MFLSARLLNLKRLQMSDYLKTYSVRVKFLEEMRYGQHITAPDEETALKLFIEEYLDVRFVREEK